MSASTTRPQTTEIQARFTPEELQRATGGRWVQGQNVLEFPPAFPEAPLCSDTRSLQPGDFYVPLRGERFNGHDFLLQALDQGAIGAMVAEDEWNNHPEWYAIKAPILVVPEPVWAMLSAAGYHRQRVGCSVVGVTGSSGKTSLKDMLFTGLSALKRVQKTEKNYNNEVGVSKTLLGLAPSTEVLVLEMAMRGLDQIRPLTMAAQPDIAIITNIGPAHIGILGSLENIATAKCEILEGLDPQTGIALVNGDDALLMEKTRQVWKGRIETFSIAADVKQLETNPNSGLTTFLFEDHPVQLPLIGDHHVRNALATLKAAQFLNLPLGPVIVALASHTVSDGRGARTMVDSMHNISVINDAYNANPDSMKVSIEAFFKGLPPNQPTVICLAGMNELGEQSEAYHQKTGLWLANRLNHQEFPQVRVQDIWFVGDEAPWYLEGFNTVSTAPLTPKCFKQWEEVLHFLVQQPPSSLQDCLIYLKGSRKYQLESLIESFTRHFQSLSNP